MAPRVVRFVRRRYVNHFPKILREVTTGKDNLDRLVERYVATAAKIARQSMKKAPKRPKSRFGTLKAYSKNSKKYGRYYWQKVSTRDLGTRHSGMSRQVTALVAVAERA